MEVKMVVTGGGSGGHIYPALAIVDAMRRRDSDLEVLYVGTDHGLEKDLVTRAGIPFATIHARGLLVHGWAAKLGGAVAATRGLRDALILLSRYRPSVVVGTGGYVSGPVGLATVILRQPLVLQEQNVWPGFTNRKLATHATKVLVPFEEAKSNFPPGSPLTVVANPVTISVTDSKAMIRDELGMPRDTVVILATGGSQGAKALNQFLLSWVSRLNDEQNWGIFWMTGKRYYPEIKAQLGQMALDPKRVLVVEYFYQIEKYLRASDIFFGRAGAMSVADCAAFGLPAVLVPSPNVSEDHQTRNAEVLVKRGAGYMVPESQLQIRGASVLEKVLMDSGLRDKMRQNVQSLFDPEAENKVVDAILQAARV